MNKTNQLQSYEKYFDRLKLDYSYEYYVHKKYSGGRPYPGKLIAGIL